MHNILAGDVPAGRVCTFCKQTPPGFDWKVDLKGWVYGDVDTVKQAKADVEAFMQQAFNVAPGSVIPVTFKVQVNIDESSPNRTVRRDPSNSDRAAVIDYPDDLSIDVRKKYEGDYAVPGLVLDTNETDRDVMEMREFEAKHGIKRVVVPDETNLFQGSK
ncbi:MAG: hypothetical protein ACXVAG_14845 [Vulcanimicrobiaceae bacterium]